MKKCRKFMKGNLREEAFYVVRLKTIGMDLVKEKSKAMWKPSLALFHLVEKTVSRTCSSPDQI